MRFNDDLVLGLDLGTNSLGWALLRKEVGSNQPTHIVDAGVRVFEAGMDGDIASGRAESRCAERRDARSIRRNLARRRRRMLKLQHLLQKYSLLPEGDDIEVIILKLDEEARKYCRSINQETRPSDKVIAHTYPYYLRCLALDSELPPYLLGRAIYHLAQRRGFWSNRKSLTDSEEGVVKEGISQLSKDMDEAGARTLGEYFAYVDPTKTRIRKRWTARSMYKDEFTQIMKMQSELLTDAQVKQIEKAIFFQRKLKSVKHLIGHCSLEKNKIRCPWYRIEAQQFRILQNLNNLRVTEFDGTLRDLSQEEYSKLLVILNAETDDLDKNGNIKITKARKLISLPKGATFSIEAGGEKSLKGNRTLAAVKRVFGDRWDEFSDSDQEKMIHDLHSFEKEKPLIKRAMNVWKLTPEKAVEFAAIRLEADYCNLSLKAIKRLNPLLREGMAYSEAVKEVYPDSFKSDGIVHDHLPMLNTASLDLRNPVVERCLTELRQVVNSVIRKYGKPGSVRVELARDIKRSNKEKKSLIKKNRELEKERNIARNEIETEFPAYKPNRDDILKIQLAKECNWICPYTGRGIGLKALLGTHPQFEIEHIIPRSRSLDDSYINKTLCYTEENSKKGNRTPYEAYHDTKQYDDILNRVTSFNGRLSGRKLELFEMQPDEVEKQFADFSSRHLNDTRYASKEAAAYLGLLYGGVNSAIDGKRRVNVLSGGLTYNIRSMYNMNNILGDGDLKTRDDHRHHAVDAVAIAMTSNATVQKLSKHALSLEESGNNYIHFSMGDGKPVENWDSFLDDLEETIDKIKVSHHISKKVRGSFHKETFYSKEHDFTKNGKEIKVRHVRTPVEALSIKDIDRIVDSGIQKAIIEKLTQLGMTDPKKAFKEPENHPVLKSSDGRTRIPIHKVKIRRTQNTITVGEGKRQRNVVTSNNHHMMIYAELDDQGDEIKWHGEVVTMLEARQRLISGKPVINKVNEKNKKFKMTVRRGDVFELDVKGNREQVLVRAISEAKTISFVRINDARLKRDIMNSHEWFFKQPNTLRTSNPIKYTITPLGELRRAND